MRAFAAGAGSAAQSLRSLRSELEAARKEVQNIQQKVETLTVKATTDPLTGIRVVLVEPQDPVNIAAARPSTSLPEGVVMFAKTVSGRPIRWFTKSSM